MSFFNIPVLRQGNIIELMPLGSSEPKRLAVVEACSGIRSLTTLVTLDVVYAYFTKPDYNSRVGHFLKNFTFWRSLILVLAAVPIAISDECFKG